MQKVILVLNANDCATTGQMAFTNFLKSIGFKDEHVKKYMKDEKKFFIARDVESLRRTLASVTGNMIIASFPNEPVMMTPETKNVLKKHQVSPHLLFQTENLSSIKDKTERIKTTESQETRRTQIEKTFKEKGIEIKFHDYLERTPKSKVWETFFKSMFSQKELLPQKPVLKTETTTV